MSVAVPPNFTVSCLFPSSKVTVMVAVGVFTPVLASGFVDEALRAQV